MSRLARIQTEHERAERIEGIRTLLASPLVLASAGADRFANVVRHRGYLADWFADHPGWRLVIDPAAGFARLHKVPARDDSTRPARKADRSPFDRRRYALLCLTLVALDDGPTQTTLARIARVVEETSADEEAIPTFDPSLAAERRAFVDALRLLGSLGVLRVRDGDTDRYAQSSEGDALFDVNESLLGQIVSAPIPPALAGSLERMLDEQLADTEGGVHQQARFHVIRRLLDEPVLYYDELQPPTREWLDPSRGYVYRTLESDVGLRLEKRKEGLAAIDPEGDLTDERFPDGGSTVKHAALLLASTLSRRPDRGEAPVDRAELIAVMAEIQAAYGERCNWSKQYPADADGTERLCDEVLALLEAFGLVRRETEGRWLVRAASARFAPTTPTSRRDRR